MIQPNKRTPRTALEILAEGFSEIDAQKIEEEDDLGDDFLALLLIEGSNIVYAARAQSKAERERLINQVKEKYTKIGETWRGKLHILKYAVPRGMNTFAYGCHEVNLGEARFSNIDEKGNPIRSHGDVEADYSEVLFVNLKPYHTPVKLTEHKKKEESDNLFFGAVPRRFRIAFE